MSSVIAGCIFIKISYIFLELTPKARWDISVGSNLNHPICCEINNRNVRHHQYCFTLALRTWHSRSNSAWATADNQYIGLNCLRIYNGTVSDKEYYDQV